VRNPRTRFWLGKAVWPLLAGAPLALACGGMTADDGPTGTGGADGGVSSGGTAGTGGTAVATGGSDGGGGTEAETVCTSDAECTVIPVACCACEPLGAEDLRAVNGHGYDQYQYGLCSGVDCVPCFAIPETERTSQYFVGMCIEGECTLLDIRPDHTECNTGEDCVLYDGNHCCSDCDNVGFIAVSSFEFLGDRCDTVSPCAPCPSTTPVGVSAQCNLDTHRCDVVDTR